MFKIIKEEKMMSNDITEETWALLNTIGDTIDNINPNWETEERWALLNTFGDAIDNINSG